MEGTFASAKNQYKSNYVQYALTSEENYKTAYEAAQATMDNILAKAPPQEPEKLKPISEKSYINFHQTQSPASLPSQGWKYWTLGSLLLVGAVLAMF